jgi:hypothetical protein
MLTEELLYYPPVIDHIFESFCSHQITPLLAVCRRWNNAVLIAVNNNSNNKKMRKCYVEESIPEMNCVMQYTLSRHEHTDKDNQLKGPNYGLYIDIVDRDHFKCFEYACNNGYKLCIDTLSYIIRSNKPEYVEYANYVRQSQQVYDSPCITAITRQRKIDEYRFLKKEKMLTEKFFANIAKEGDIETIKYLCSLHCPWDEEACSNAAGNGYLNCLAYLHRNHAPWDEDTCIFAAESGHLECLKYAHENGCPWNEDALNAAEESGYAECVNYFKKNFNQKT